MKLRKAKQIADDAIEEWIGGITRISDLPTDAMIIAAKQIVARAFWNALKGQP